MNHASESPTHTLYGECFAIAIRRLQKIAARVGKTLSLIGLALCLLPLTAAAGVLLTPNGDPTGAGTAFGVGGGGSMLDPLAAFEQTQPQIGPGSTDDLLLFALAAQGFGGAGWTINFVGLKGNDITLGTYLAWADNAPRVTQGALVAPPQALPGRGGAAIGLNYNGANDATGKDPAANTHWVQFIEDNNPTPFEKAHGIPDPIRAGYTLSIDDPFAPKDANGNPTTPFYDAGGLANATDFIDRPFDSLNSRTDLLFYTFIETGEIATKTLTCYDDVAWGVDIPEPSSLLLVFISLLLFWSPPRIRRAFWLR